MDSDSRQERTYTGDTAQEAAHTFSQKAREQLADGWQVSSLELRGNSITASYARNAETANRPTSDRHWWAPIRIAYEAVAFVLIVATIVAMASGWLSVQSITLVTIPVLLRTIGRRSSAGRSPALLLGVPSHVDEVPARHGHLRRLVEVKWRFEPSRMR